MQITPEELKPQVYIPARQGSLQAELLAASRRQDRLPYAIEPTAEALRAQLDAGQPVLILQNFGSGSSPLWHYAVVIGYEPGARAYLLRSGVTQRERLVSRRFLATWARADNWGMVVAKPGDLPVGAQAAPYLRAASGLEAAGRQAAAYAAFSAGVTRWPEEPAAWFGLAGAQLDQGQTAEAESTYRQLLRIAPSHAAAHNNLAVLLARRGCIAAARAELNLARATAARHFAAELADTGTEIEHLSSLPGDAATNCTPP